MTKKSGDDLKRLEDLGLISKRVVERRNRDIEIYLKEKVKKDRLTIDALLLEFKKIYPDTTVHLPAYS